MNTDLRKAVINDFEKKFLKLMNNSAFGKTMENERKHWNIKQTCDKRKKKKLFPVKFLTENLLAIEMKKNQMHMNKPVYLGLSILDLSKTVWLCKTKIWRKSKTVSYGYRQFHWIHKSRWYL